MRARSPMPPPSVVAPRGSPTSTSPLHWQPGVMPPTVIDRMTKAAARKRVASRANLHRRQGAADHRIILAAILGYDAPMLRSRPMSPPAPRVVLRAICGSLALALVCAAAGTATAQQD